MTSGNISNNGMNAEKVNRNNVLCIGICISKQHFPKVSQTIPTLGNYIFLYILLTAIIY